MKVWMTTLMLIASTSFANNNIQMMVADTHNHDAEVKIQSFVEGEKGYVDTYMIQTERLVVKPMEVTGFSSASVDKLNKAFAALEEVVNSEEFKDKVINFKNTQGQRAFASNKGLTNEQIYAIFMEGRETLQPNTPNEMNFYLKQYNNRWSAVIGQTSPTTNVISINWKFFKNFEPSDVAGNLCHEWVHKIGFDHTSAAEHDSAPYAIGYIARDMAAKVLKGMELH
jgi:hypothetical protein